MQPLELLTQKFNVDVGANRINKYDEQCYTVNTPKGVFDLPSVSLIKEIFPKSKGLELFFKKYGNDADTIRDEAGQLGTHVHKIIQQTLIGETVSFENEDGKRNCSLVEWERYLSWCLWYQSVKEELALEPIAVEQIVWDLDLFVAGTVDLIAKTNRGIEIFDWKTGGSVDDDASVQVAAYWEMTNRMKIFGKVEFASIVQLNPKLNKAGFRAKEIENLQQYFGYFLNCKEIWKGKNKNFKPKYRTYPNQISLESLNAEKLSFMGAGNDKTHTDTNND